MARWEGSVEVRFWEKEGKKKVQGEQPKKVDWGAMLVNAGLGAR